MLVQNGEVNINLKPHFHIHYLNIHYLHYSQAAMRSSVISPTMSENTQSGKKRQYRHILNAQDRPILNAQDQPIPETGCDVEYRGADKLKGKKALITARE